MDCEKWRSPVRGKPAGCVFAACPRAEDGICSCRRRDIVGKEAGLGTVALIVFLSSLGMALFSLALLVRSALHIYRTLRYAYKDSQPWNRIFSEHASRFGDFFRSMEERAQNIAEAGRDTRSAVDDIRDFLEEMRSHPLLRAARLVGRLRRRPQAMGSPISVPTHPFRPIKRRKRQSNV